MRRGPTGVMLELGAGSAYPSQMTARARKPAAPPPPPTPEEEAAAFAASLERAGKAVTGRGPLPSGATHRIVVTPTGAKRLKRKRYSAV